VLISPWTDLSLSGDTLTSHAARDPILSHSITSLWARLYADELPTTHPLCSPLFAQLAALPPILIQVGSEEILLSDSQRLAQRAEAAGVPTRLHVYDGMWHDFQIQAGVLHESDAAIFEIGAFVKQHIPG
jgi:epsilon-lactone hydrolase